MNRVIVCQSCGTQVEGAVCPRCERITKDPQSLKRRPERRPVLEEKFQTVSSNFNGLFTVKQAPDGAYVCNCPSFLLQNGTVEENIGFPTCKHIRKYTEQNGVPKTCWKPASEYQQLLLKALGVTKIQSLTNSQAYFIIQELLQLRGITYPELVGFLKKGVKPSLLPLYMFGVELEGNIKDKEEFKNHLEAAGFPVAVTGYTGNTRAANEWRISHDGSVGVENGFQPLELVTPKLWGWRGLTQLQKVLEIWNNIGAKHPASAGTHIHIDGYGVDREFIERLTGVWCKIETPYLWYLVSPSRRNNHYARVVDTDFLRVVARGNMPNRYYSLNLNAAARHGTIEFRLMNCTTNFEKISSWCILLLCLFDAIKKGITEKDIPSTFEAFLDLIGMDQNACSVLQQTRNYLVERYLYWKKDAEENPSHVPTPPEIPQNVTWFLRNQSLLQELNTLQHAVQYIDRNWTTKRGLFLRYHVERDSFLLREPFHHLVLMIKHKANKVVGTNEVAWENDSTIKVQNTRVTVGPNNELTCNCRYGRNRTTNEASGGCFHMKYAARLILKTAILRRIAELQRQAAEGGEICVE